MLTTRSTLSSTGTSPRRSLRTGARVPAGVIRRILLGVSTTRLVAIAVAIAVTAAFGATDDARSDSWWTLVAVLAALALPWQLYLHRRAWADGRWPWLAGLGDVVVLTALGLAVPTAAWPAVMVGFLSAVAVDATVSGRLAATVTAVVAATVAVFAAAAVDVEHSAVLLVSLFFGMTAIVITAGRLSDEQHRTIRRFGALLDGVPGIVWEADADDEHLVMVSGRVRDILGYSPIEFARQHMTWGQLVHPDDQHLLIDVEQIDEMPWPHVREFRIRSRHGSWVWLRDVVRAERRPDGTWALRGVATDITVQREATERAHHFTRLMDEMSAPTLIVGVDPTITLDQIEATGQSPLTIIRSNISATAWSAAGPLDGYRMDDVDWLVRLDVAADVAQVLRTGEPVVRKEIDAPAERVDGALFDLEIRPLGATAVSVVFQDVTERVATREYQRREALHDPLTGLPNRAHLMERLRQQLRRADADTDLALLVLDLDQFKEVNDTLGHHHGDALLRQVAARLADLRRGDDLVARLGGDEFAVMLAVDGSRRAESVAASIIENVSAPLTLQDLQVQSAASIGYALFPDDAKEPEELLQRAEVAMYQAKETRQPFTAYSASDDKYSMRRLRLLGELPRALSGDEITVYYQPKIDLDAGTVVGVEALVRWLHPELGMVRPDEFIELTEVSGLINELTRKVVRQSIAQVRAWDRLGIHIGVAVNLSARNFHDPGLADFIVSELLRNDVSADRLVLEITESEVVDDLDLAVDVLRTLSDRGIRTSIDDFGTGFSSFTHLRRLPVHEIKIDRTFVGQMATNSDDLVIVRSIVNLGHDLQLEVVAEGVEDEWTLDNLRQLGCDRAQGYFFRPAVPAEEIPSYVDDLAATAR